MHESVGLDVWDHFRCDTIVPKESRRMPRLHATLSQKAAWPAASALPWCIVVYITNGE